MRRMAHTAPRHEPVPVLTRDAAGSAPITSFTSGQLITSAGISGLTARATYIASDSGEEFFAPAANMLVPLYARVRCDLPGFGGTWTGLVDDAPAITAAAAYAATFSPRRAIELPRLVGCGSSAFIPIHVHVFGRDYSPGKIVNTKIIPLTSMVLSTGYFLNLNTNDGISNAYGPNAWDVGAQVGLFGVFFDNTPNDMPGARLCVFAGNSGQFEDIHGFFHVQLLRQAPNVYCDSVLIKRVRAHRSLDNSEYSIKLGSNTGGGGDSVIIEGSTCSSGIYNANVPEKFIDLRYSNCGTIRNLINGSIYLHGCAQVLIENWHNEAAQLTVERSSFIVRNSNFDIKPTTPAYYPIDLTMAYGTTTDGFVGLFDNVQFRWGMRDREGIYPAEVRAAKGYLLKFINCNRSVSSSNNISMIGWRINDATDTPIAKWNNNAGYLSASGELNNWIPSGIYDAVIPSSTAFAGTSTPSKVTGRGPSTFVGGQTYYYRMQLLLDTTRLIGLDQTFAEVSVTMSATVANTERVVVPTGVGSSPPSLVTIRIYRGTTSGTYDSYCDVPSVRFGTAQDTGPGGTVNGLPWLPWGPGPVATLAPTPIGAYQISPELGARLVLPYEGAANLQGTADATLGSPAASVNTAVIVSALTADHSYQIHSGITQLGSRVRIVRNSAATGAFNANFKDPGGTTLKALASSNTWAEAELCYGNVWRLTGYGAL